LTDLGCDLYLTLLNPDTVERLYADAIKRLVIMQKQARIAQLPPYDRRLLREEMELFRVWLVGQELGIALKPQQHKRLDRAFELLADSALSQPQVFVHRDYHSRNLLYTAQNNPGILDFQDAVLGPVSYDLVSLLRDCYIRWPIEQVEAWVFSYYEQARQAGLLPHISADVFLRWFDLMGVQRHLKASGIFARLWHRDGKPGYLPDVPRTLSYIVEVGPKYPQLKALHQFLIERILPALAQRSSL
jgi:aminoglycoside/choline kinase family phosphotransferase